MTLKDKINGILTKYGVKLSVEDAAKQVEFMAKGTTTDGIEVMSPDAEFAVGSEVFYNDADGNPVPLTDGEYVINDGTLDMTVVGGKITELEPVEVEAKKDKEKMDEELSSVIEQLAQRVAELEAKMTEKDTQLSAVNQELETTKSEKAQAEAKVAELSKQPAATSVKAAAQKSAKPEDEPIPTALQSDLARRIYTGIQKNK